MSIFNFQYKRAMVGECQPICRSIDIAIPDALRCNKGVIDVIRLICMTVHKESGRAFFTLLLLLLVMICGAQSHIRQHPDYGAMIALPSAGLTIPLLILLKSPITIICG